MNIDKVKEKYEIADLPEDYSNSILFLDLVLIDGDIETIEFRTPKNHVKLTMQEYNILTAVLSHIIRDKVESKNTSKDYKILKED